ncbi:hypothetical protein F2P44_03080 [Massilia sp. CCM 8695]|uniref:KAP NTPase domain-containing protein n=1 Tax=Massilia frigida TaxID=2609281 RepID=A0ABX0MZ74_9BURK|nr:P-loop NTPase fold protein [Massilia frigida]NHZ78271.1 hypothetical protein [Massilia frigida]
MAKMSENSLFLEDVPSDKDQLNSHEGIAKAMKRIICEGKGGKTIGLEGKWGAGKSSIIRLLQKACSVQEKVFFFNFDAWVHAGDPLRRAFLEALIEASAGEKGFFRLHATVAPESGKENAAAKATAVCAKWMKKKSDLSRRIKQHEKRVEPIISGVGKALLVSLSLLPIALSVLVLTLTKYADSLKFDAWPLAFGEGLLVVAVTCVVTPYLLMAHLLRKHGDGDGDGERGQLWTIFFQKGPTSERSQTSESLEPSTIEFQAIFNELMVDLLDKDQWKLVIVLDNLDRLSEDEASAVWPVLRAFIDNPQFIGAEWFKRLWVIVPYARDALVVPAAEKEDASQQAISQASGQDAAGGIVESGSHFLDKIFQLNVFVPAPVLSNWRIYMDEQIRKVFCEKATPDVLHTIYVLFARCFGVSHPPGPRELISIVNNMVIINLQWGDEIILPHYAYFSILKRSKKIHDLRREILEKRITLHEDLLGNDIEISLLALESSLPKESAAQILDRQLIEDLLSSRAAGRGLAERYDERQFADLFDSVIGDTLVGRARDPIGFIDALLVLLEKAFIEKNSAHKRALLIGNIGKAIAVVTMLPMGSPKLAGAIEALVNQDESRALKECIGLALRRSKMFFTNIESKLLFSITVSGDAGPLQSVYRLWSSPTLRKYLGDADADALTSYSFPLSVAELIPFYSRLKEHGREELLDAFNLDEVEATLRAELNATFHHRTAEAKVTSLRFLNARSGKVEAALLEKLIELLVEENSPVRVDDLAVTLPYLFEVACAHNEAKIVLQSLMSSPSLYEYLRVLKRNPEPDVQLLLSDMRPLSEAEKELLCGYLLYLLLYTYPTLPSYSGSVNLGRVYLQTMLTDPKEYSGILIAFRNAVIDMHDLDHFLDQFKGRNVKQMMSFLATGTLPPGSMFDSDHEDEQKEDSEEADGKEAGKTADEMPG